MPHHFITQRIILQPDGNKLNAVGAPLVMLANFSMRRVVVRAALKPPPNHAVPAAMECCDLSHFGRRRVGARRSSATAQSPAP